MRVVCIDMNSAYRNLVRQWFPNAKIVSDRFHVIRLVQHHFSKVCKLVDEAHLAHGRGGLLRLLLTRPEKLDPERQARLARYFEVQPALRAVYEFCHGICDLLRVAEAVWRMFERFWKRLRSYGRVRSKPCRPWVTHSIHGKKRLPGCSGLRGTTA